jgi:hypothetical protein
MVGVDTMAIGGSDIAKELLRVRIVYCSKEKFK